MIYKRDIAQCLFINYIKISFKNNRPQLSRDFLNPERHALESLSHNPGLQAAHFWPVELALVLCTELLRVVIMPSGCLLGIWFRQYGTEMLLSRQEVFQGTPS